MRTLYTDGSCIHNGKKGARASWAVVDHEGFEICGPVPDHLPQTNQVAELYAIKMALSQQSQGVLIVTDSMYSINCLTRWCNGWKKNGWKTSKGVEVLNRDLIEEIVDQIDSGVQFQHYPSHTKKKEHSPHWRGNHRADQLARSQVPKS